MFKIFLKNILKKYLYSFNILQAPRVCKNNHIMCCDWLPELGRMELSCTLGTARCIPQESLSVTTMLKIYFWPSLCCLVKMARYWPRPFFAFYKHAINMSLASRCKSRTWPISNPSWLHACSIINTEESEENMRGRSSIQYKIKVQSWMKGQIVIFQHCSKEIWQWLPDDMYFPNLPMDFKSSK